MRALKCKRMSPKKGNKVNKTIHLFHQNNRINIEAIQEERWEEDTEISPNNEAGENGAPLLVNMPRTSHKLPKCKFETASCTPKKSQFSLPLNGKPRTASSTDVLVDTENDNIEELSANSPSLPNLPHHSRLNEKNEEDIASVVPIREAHFNPIQHSEIKGQCTQFKESFAKCIDSIEKGESLNDFKEGFLFKKSNGILEQWKQKYCRIGHSSFIIFKNLETGQISGFLDLKRMPACLTFDNSIFTLT